MGLNTKSTTTRAVSGSHSVLLRVATRQDCLSVGARLIEEARLEVQHVVGRGMSMGDALDDARLKFPGTLCGYLNGRPEAIFGCYSVGKGRATVWFLPTAKVAKYPLLLTRHALNLVAHWKAKHGVLEGSVLAETKAVKWLTLLGFDIYPAQEAQCADGTVNLYHPFRT